MLTSFAYNRKMSFLEGETCDISPSPQEQPPAKPATIVFDNDDEYVGFIKYVFAKFGGAGFGPSNVPVRLSLRVEQSLLNKTKDLFGMRPVSDEDIEQARKRLADLRPSDLEHIGGYPFDFFDFPLSSEEKTKLARYREEKNKLGK